MANGSVLGVARWCFQGQKAEFGTLDTSHNQQFAKVYVFLLFNKHTHYLRLKEATIYFIGLILVFNDLLARMISLLANWLAT